MAEKETDPKVLLKGAGELHIKDIGVFLVVGKAGERKAYYKNGKPVESGKLFLCKYCPCVMWKEIDFAKHMVKRHPEHATMKIEKAEEKIVEKTAKK